VMQDLIPVAGVRDRGQQQVGDQESAEHEEDVHAEEAAGQFRRSALEVPGLLTADVREFFRAGGPTTGAGG
jgi:hypothetical protein